MDGIDRLLEYVRKTNQKMDKKTLIERLNENYYSAFGLVLTFKNSCINNE